MQKWSSDLEVPSYQLLLLDRASNMSRVGQIYKKRFLFGGLKRIKL